MLVAWVIGFGLAASAAQASPRPSGDAPIVVEDPRALFVSPLSIHPLPKPQWVTHRVRPRDSLTKIAARYAVTAEDIREWNRLEPDTELSKRRKTVRVLARRAPPPPVKVVYVVKAGESWEDLSAKLRVSKRELRATHYRMRKLVPGAKITAWIDPIEGPAFDPSTPDIQPEFTVPTGGRSVGMPNKGRLVDGVQLPESPLWVRGNPRKLWASSHTLATVQRAFLILRNDIGYASGVLIGAMSHKHGGKFPPHRSHQSGRDIDIRLPLKHGLGKTKHPTADDIDWYATWAIVDAFIQTGQVESVFLDISRQERLFTAARVIGVPAETLHDIVRWPTWKGNIAPIVRHADGHETHMHVRIKCAADEAKCKSGP